MADDTNKNQADGPGIASGSLEEISLGIVVFHADGTSTDHGVVSHTNFKEQAEEEAEAKALASAKQKGLLKRLYGASKRLKGKNNNG